MICTDNECMYTMKEDKSMKLSVEMKWKDENMKPKEWDSKEWTNIEKLKWTKCKYWSALCGAIVVKVIAQCDFCVNCRRERDTHTYTHTSMPLCSFVCILSANLSFTLTLYISFTHRNKVEKIANNVIDI